MKSFQVIRTHISPYQAQDFIHRESFLLSNLEGVDYLRLEDAQADKPTVLITNTHTVLSDISHDLLRQTKLIIHPNSGYDHFAKDYEIWRSIPVVIGHEIRAQAVAEYSLGCLFDSQNRPLHQNWDKSRLWSRKLIKDSRIVVFGYGHIGQIICQTLHALGASVTVVDPYLETSPFHHFDRWEDTDIGTYDVVICALSLNESSQGIFNKNFFSQVNPRLVFINGARGGLYDEKALKDFFQKHDNARAYLDVFPDEPFKGPWSMKNVFTTSHIAGVHAHLDQGILNFEFNVMEDFLTMSMEEFKSFYRHELLQNKIIEGKII